MNNKTKLQLHCEMIWARRANELHIHAFTAVVSTLEYLEADRDGKTWSYLLLIQRFDFVITLVTIEHVLQSLELLPVTTFLQAKQRHLVEAPKELEAVTVIS